jgi:hypothetical protein
MLMKLSRTSLVNCPRNGGGLHPSIYIYEEPERKLQVLIKTSISTVQSVGNAG